MYLFWTYFKILPFPAHNVSFRHILFIPFNQPTFGHPSCSPGGRGLDSNWQHCLNGRPTLRGTSECGEGKKTYLGIHFSFLFFFCCALISFRLALFDVRFWPHRFNSIFEANRLRSQSGSFILSSLEGRRGVGGGSFFR